MTIATQVTVIKGDNILSAWILNGVKFRITAHTDIMHDAMLAGGGSANSQVKPQGERG